MSEKLKVFGIDLTSIGAGTPLPEDRTHPIFQYPEPLVSPRTDIPHGELVVMFYDLQGRLEALEQWRIRGYETIKSEGSKNGY